MAELFAYCFKEKVKRDAEFFTDSLILMQTFVSTLTHMCDTRQAFACNPLLPIHFSQSPDSTSRCQRRTTDMVSDECPFLVLNTRSLCAKSPFRRPEITRHEMNERLHEQ
jgi:hypothetical protein